MFATSGFVMHTFLTRFCAILFLFGLAACDTAPVKPASGSTTARTPSSSDPIPAPAPATTASVPKTNQGYTGTAEGKPPEPVAAATEPVKPPGEVALSEGSALYEKGDYRGAIRKLSTARDTLDDSSAQKKTSLRLLAFSYCVTNQKPLCRQQFNALLKIDPSFELAKAEAGHPLWGPVFKEAKLAVAPAAPKKK
jgi:hypothetical protein